MTDICINGIIYDVAWAQTTPEGKVTGTSAATSDEAKAIYHLAKEHFRKHELFQKRKAPLRFSDDGLTYRREVYTHAFPLTEKNRERFPGCQTARHVWQSIQRGEVPKERPVKRPKRALPPPSIRPAAAPAPRARTFRETFALFDALDRGETSDELTAFSEEMEARYRNADIRAWKAGYLTEYFSR